MYSILPFSSASSCLKVLRFYAVFYSFSLTCRLPTRKLTQLPKINSMYYCTNKSVIGKSCYRKIFISAVFLKTTRLRYVSIGYHRMGWGDCVGINVLNPPFLIYIFNFEGFTFSCRLLQLHPGLIISNLMFQ